MWMMWHPLGMVRFLCIRFMNLMIYAVVFFFFSAGQASIVDPVPPPIDQSGAHRKSRRVIYKDTLF